MDNDEATSLYPDPLRSELNDPSSFFWKEGGRVHNWQNYIGERTQVIWNSLTDEVKKALALDAHDLAMREEWD